MIALSAITLVGCAHPNTATAIDTTETAKFFVEACMGEWVHTPPTSGDAAGPFRLSIRPDGQFEAVFGEKKLSGNWDSFGTLDAAVRMTDSISAEELRIYECPFGAPSVTIGDRPDEYRVRRPS